MSGATAASPSFATVRLLFRPFQLRDATEAFAIFGDPEVMRYSISGRDADSAVTAARIGRILRQTGEPGLGPWAVVERASEQVIGVCGLIRLKDTAEVEIAYRLRRDRWGNGLATEAASAWLHRGLADLHLPRIFAFVEPTNHASLRVVVKIGMRFVDDTLYAGIPVRRYEITNPQEPAPPAP
jgi:[ribosomal protein S5]-alanine N-acetyltransferase